MLTTFAGEASPRPEKLETVEVAAERVPESAESFPMPVTALSFNMQTDLQLRSMSEAQSDISIRGGTYENATLAVGAVPVFDPQTGHYLAELPIAPAMLGAPEIRAGSALAQGGWNATAGTIAYGWRPIETGGALALTGGSYGLFTADAYAGFLYPKSEYKKQVGFDFSASYSRDDGSVDLSDHDFSRFGGRIQLRDEVSQTDIFAGTQAKNFAWPNLYAGRTPGGPRREERDDLETQLYAINHRQEINGAGDWIQTGVFYRNNKDHYSIPVFAYNAHHRAQSGGGALDGRFTVLENETSGIGTTALRYRAGIVADDLNSDTLIYGNYNSRTQVYAGIYADQTVPVGEKKFLVFTAGATLDHSNREGTAGSPVAGVAWENKTPAMSLRRVALDYSEATQVPSYTALNGAPGGLFGGDPNLGRSRARNVELAADFAAGTDGEWTISPKIFYRRDSDSVDWVFDPSNPASSRVARSVNLDTYGAELTIKGSWSIFDFTFGYAWMHKTDDYTSDVTASFYAMNFAEHRLLAGIVARLGYGFEICCDNEFRVQEENALREGTHAPVFTSLSVIYRVPDISGLSIFARIDNLWDVAYEAVPLVPGTPRTWSAGMSYVW